MSTVTIKTECPATCVEFWEVEVAEGSLLLDDDRLRELAFNRVLNGEAKLIEDRCEDEHDREPTTLYR